MKLSAGLFNMNTEKMRGRVFNIQRFSLHDGPGIRTVVFFKGCQMSCIWCANPEGLRQENDIFWRAASCEHCGACVGVCQSGVHQWDGKKHVIDASASCQGCRLCEESCPSQALKVVGHTMSSDEVYQEVIKDTAYYQLSGGGVTLSGGEVMLQPDFAVSLLNRFRREGIHTAVETAGFAPWSAVAKVSTASNLVLYDLKLADNTLHQRFTGVSNIRILRNLEKLLTLNIPLRLRIPVIPGVNDTSEEIKKMLDLISKLTSGKTYFQGVDLLPYHAYGVQKYSLLGRDYPARIFIRHETENNGEVFLQAAKARGISAKLSTSVMG
ncbi:glycyl-radical enzyme activator family protein [Enterobacteriaceae bacterium strain FGI 57]|nr:glycyl-radical enzyme activator family protein [Enterobacteriaceae bacterium strain FGI 57]